MPVLTPATASETVTAIGSPALTLIKSAVSGNPYDTVGDVVAYEYVVTNTGNVTINALTVTDDKSATVNCPVTTLAPGASTTCTASYTIVQADLDAGLVTNNATATGTPTQGTLTPATASETAASSATPSLQLIKTAVSGAPYDAVGDVVSYTYQVTSENGDDQCRIGDGRQDPDGDLSGHDTRAGREHDLHGELHDHPGRSGRRVGDQSGTADGVLSQRPRCAWLQVLPVRTAVLVSVATWPSIRGRDQAALQQIRLQRSGSRKL